MIRSRKQVEPYPIPRTRSWMIPVSCRSLLLRILVLVVLGHGVLIATHPTFRGWLAEQLRPAIDLPEILQEEQSEPEISVRIEVTPNVAESGTVIPRTDSSRADPVSQRFERPFPQ